MQGSNEQPGKWPPQNGSNRGETSTDERLDSGVEFHKKKKNSGRSLPHERISQGGEVAPKQKRDGHEGRLEVDTGV